MQRTDELNTGDRVLITRGYGQGDCGTVVKVHRGDQGILQVDTKLDSNNLIYPLNPNSLRLEDEGMRFKDGKVKTKPSRLVALQKENARLQEILRIYEGKDAPNGWRNYAQYLVENAPPGGIRGLAFRYLRDSRHLEDFGVKEGRG